MVTSDGATVSRYACTAEQPSMQQQARPVAPAQHGLDISGCHSVL